MLLQNQRRCSMWKIPKRTHKQAAYKACDKQRNQNIAMFQNVCACRAWKRGYEGLVQVV